MERDIRKDPEALDEYVLEDANGNIIPHVIAANDEVGMYLVCIDGHYTTHFGDIKWSKKKWTEVV